MGAYLDKPVVDKESGCSQLPSGIVYGHSTMQGWRTTQEDAHACAVNFDERHPGRHLFAVFDGHGGPEVARYVSEQLPEYLMETDSYQRGDFDQALKDAFLGLDAKLLEPAVAAKLKVYAKAGHDDSESDQEAMVNEATALREEADMPLDRLLRTIGASVRRARQRGDGASEAPDADKGEGDGEGGGSSGGSQEAAAAAAENENNENTEREAAAAAGASTSAAANGDGDDNGEASTSKVTAGPNGDNEDEEEEEADNDKDYVPGEEVPDDDDEEEEEDEKDKDAGDEEEDEEEAEGVEGENDEEGEEDDDDEEEEEADSDEESESEEESEEDYEVIMPAGDDPGVDSGTTAVVALLVDGRLYVANAGDSRAVLSESGAAVDMSEDHKPEDEPERQRIESAGGHVTKEGRVNGGLNLSRALGDHAYKQNAELSAAKQIISPMPDVRCVDLADSHRFLLLACDGIWNSMSSQEAVDFCGKRLAAGCPPDRVCEALFDHCLAADAQESDGTGCDNMTAVLVCFRGADEAAADEADAQLPRKRQLSAAAVAAEGANGGSLGESESKKVKEG